MQNQLYQLGERRPCQECGKALVYGSLGWLHVRKPAQPHVPSVAATPPDPTYSLVQRISELEEMVAAKDTRIQVLLAEAEKVRK